MKIGVVGAHGFIGSNLGTFLRSIGHDVVAYTSEFPVTSERGLDEARGLDGLVWCASNNTPATIGTNPERGEEELSEFRNSLTALAPMTRPRLVLLSSGGTVYGSASCPHREDDELQPVSDYGRFKVRMEQVARERRPDVTILRPSNVYGPGQHAKGGQGVLGHWLEAIVSGSQPVIYGDPAVSRDYVYVGDCVDAISRALVTPAAAGNTINIGSGHPTSLTDLFATVREVTGTDIEPRLEQGRPYDIESTWLHIGRARDVLHWEPTTSLSDGIRSMWEWKEKQ